MEEETTTSEEKIEQEEESVDNTENCKSITENIIGRVMKRNQNFLACFTGKVGSGKTYGALTMCEQLSKITRSEFTIENIVFSATELMNLIMGTRLKKGSCILFDEAGVGYNNREWNTVGNKMLNYLLQTFRSRNYIVIFTMPDFSFIDVGARKLFHARFETLSINYKNCLLRVRPLFLTVSQSTGKLYNKYFRVKGEGLNYGKIKNVYIHLPSKELVEQYEEKKLAYTNQLYKEIQEELLDLKLTGKVKKRPGRPPKRESESIMEE